MATGRVGGHILGHDVDRVGVMVEGHPSPRWVVREGRVYHYERQCPTLRNSTVTEASAQDLRVRPSCLVCHPRVQEMRAELAREGGASDRPDAVYERIFQEDLLDPTVASTPSSTRIDVRPQFSVVIGDRRYILDFALLGGAQRVAIEIDGLDKIDPKDPRRVDLHNAQTARWAALEADGWKVLRFTNHQVVLEPEVCRSNLVKTLQTVSPPDDVVPETKPGPAHPGAEQRVATVPNAALGNAASASNGGRQWRWVVAGVLAVALLGIGGWYWIGVRGADDGSVPPDVSESGWVSCPRSHPIKGNVSDDGAKIFHIPGSTYYDDTKPEICFDTASAAKEEGFRPSFGG